VVNYDIVGVGGCGYGWQICRASETEIEQVMVARLRWVNWLYLVGVNVKDYKRINITWMLNI